MTVTIDLRPEVEAWLVQQAHTAKQPISEYVNSLIEQLIVSGRQETKQEIDLNTFLAMPRDEQDRLMTLAAEDAAPLYAADLALSPEDRELTAFTALRRRSSVVTRRSRINRFHCSRWRSLLR